MRRSQVAEVLLRGSAFTQDKQRVRKTPCRMIGAGRSFKIGYQFTILFVRRQQGASPQCSANHIMTVRIGLGTNLINVAGLNGCTDFYRPLACFPADTCAVALDRKRNSLTSSHYCATRMSSSA